MDDHLPLKTNPKWDLVTTFAVNLFNVDTHHHGNRRFYKGLGPLFVKYDDAVELLARIIKGDN